MNEGLFPSHEAAVIANLRRIIRKFKAYDKERTAQYKQLLKDNEWLRKENTILENKLKEKENGD